jgi:hypothetical protein
MAPWFALFEVCVSLIMYGASTNRCHRLGLSPKYVQLLPKNTATSNHPQLIRSPAFNRAIHKAYRKINRLPDMEPKNGGSKLATDMMRCNNTDSMAGTGPSTLDHFKDELKTQMRELTWQKRPPK